MKVIDHVWIKNQEDIPSPKGSSSILTVSVITYITIIAALCWQIRFKLCAFVVQSYALISIWKGEYVYSSVWCQLGHGIMRWKSAVLLEHDPDLPIKIV